MAGLFRNLLAAGNLAVRAKNLELRQQELIARQANKNGRPIPMDNVHSQYGALIDGIHADYKDIMDNLSSDYDSIIQEQGVSFTKLIDDLGNDHRKVIEELSGQTAAVIDFAILLAAHIHSMEEGGLIVGLREILKDMSPKLGFDAAAFMQDVRAAAERARKPPVDEPGSGLASGP